MLGNILLGIVSTCTFISYLPQAIKIAKTKEAEDLSMSSWILWSVSSLTYATYAVLISKEIMLIFETGLEFGFCLLILILTIIYGEKKNECK